MAITLTKETGIGLTGANCYCDLDDLNDAAELLGEDLTAYDDEQKKSAIYVAANKFIDRKHDFKGEPVQPTQGMKLYTDLVTFDDASKYIIQANCEAAILHLMGRLFVDPSEQNANGEIKRTKDKLDVLEEEREYVENTAIAGGVYDTTSIDELLRPYLATGSGGVPLRLV